MEDKSEFYGFNNKIKNARRNGFRFDQINKLTMKIYSNPSKINIRYYLKHRIPMYHRQIF